MIIGHARRPAGIALAAVVALAAFTAALAGPARAQRPDQGADARTSMKALQAGLDDAWAPLPRVFRRRAEEALKQSVETVLAKGSGSAAGAKWSFKLELADVEPILGLSSPPGFRTLTATSFALGLPRAGRWKLGIRGRIKGRARVRVGGRTIFSWSPSMRFGIVLPKLRATIAGRLGVGVPQAAPATVEVTANGAAGGEGIFKKVAAASTPSPAGDGEAGLVAAIRNVGVDFPGAVSAKLDAQLFLKLLPSRHIDDEHVEVPLHQSVLGNNRIAFDVAFLDAHFLLTGKLKVKLERVGRRTVPIHVPFDLPIPSTDELNSLILLLERAGQPIPDLGHGNPTPPPPADADARLAAGAANVEQGLDAHIPYGAVLSIAGPIPGRATFAPVPLRYANQENSGLWTGTLLAAEALRYAATRDPAALARAGQVLGGIERLFDVTDDAVVFNGKRQASRTAGRIWARSALPYRDGAPEGGIDYKDGPLSARKCHYEDAERWEVPAAGGPHSFADYAAAAADASAAGLAAERIRPKGRVWFGYGCGTDKEVSRDEYTGMFLGLGFAYRLIDDAQIRARIAPLIEGALDHLLAANWVIEVPPGEKGQSYWFAWTKQLSLLRVGMLVNPAKYQSRYDKLAPAAAIGWLPALLANIDPISQYYKYNLGNSTLAPLLLLESDDVLRGFYEFESDVLNIGVRDHKNPWFAALDLLKHRPAERAAAAREASYSNPAISRADEIRSLLLDWLDRAGKVKGPRGLPREDIADPAGHSELWPNHLQLYRTIELTKPLRCLAAYPLMPSQRTGRGMHFMWQRHPFGTTFGLDGCARGRKPDAAAVQASIPDSSRENEADGADFLIAYWLAAYVRAITPGA